MAETSVSDDDMRVDGLVSPENQFWGDPVVSLGSVPNNVFQHDGMVSDEPKRTGTGIRLTPPVIASKHSKDTASTMPPMPPPTMRSRPPIGESSEQKQAKFAKLSTADAALADLVEPHELGFLVIWPPGSDYTTAKLHLRVHSRAAQLQLSSNSATSSIPPTTATTS